jgi:hypothetical protein
LISAAFCVHRKPCQVFLSAKSYQIRTFFFLCGANFDSNPSHRPAFPPKLQSCFSITLEVDIMSTEVAAVAATSQGASAPPQGMRKNGLFYDVFLFHRPRPNDRTGKQWHEPKAAFRPKAGNGTYEKRQVERTAMAAVKAKEKEMKDEKEAERQVRSGGF